ncbi:hypothetical protein BHM03_00019138 [Ensete ventricosum]|nr:hypothetical protein BHM03_00019138 [Ensete ventricosum]
MGSHDNTSEEATSTRGTKSVANLLSKVEVRVLPGPTPINVAWRAMPSPHAATFAHPPYVSATSQGTTKVRLGVRTNSPLTGIKHPFRIVIPETAQGASRLSFASRTTEGASTDAGSFDPHRRAEAFIVMVTGHPYLRLLTMSSYFVTASVVLAVRSGPITSGRPRRWSNCPGAQGRGSQVNIRHIISPPPPLEKTFSRLLIWVPKMRSCNEPSSCSEDRLVFDQGEREIDSIERWTLEMIRLGRSSGADHTEHRLCRGVISGANSGDLAEKVTSGTNLEDLVEEPISGTNRGDFIKELLSGTNPGDLAEKVTSGTNLEDLVEEPI